MPEHDALAALIQASLRNAGDLLEEACLIVGNGHSAWAHALGTLAFEEMGKAFLCVMALVPRPEPFFGLRAKGSFWAAWRDRTDKLLWAQGFRQLQIGDPGSPAAEALERLIGEVCDGHLRKLRGLYVDYDGTRLLLPGDITMEEANEVLASAESLLAVAAEAYLTAGLEERARVLIDQREDVMALLDQADQSIQADTDSAVEFQAVLPCGTWASGRCRAAVSVVDDVTTRPRPARAQGGGISATDQRRLTSPRSAMRLPA